MAVPTVEGSPTTNATLNATSLTFDIPAGATVGERLVAVAYYSTDVGGVTSPPTTSTIDGWTLRASSTTAVVRAIAFMWDRVVDGTEGPTATIDWTSQADFNGVACWRQSECEPHVAATFGGQHTSPAPIPEVTTTEADCLIVGVAFSYNASITTTPSGFTHIVNIDADFGRAYHKPLAVPGGSGTPGITAATDDEWAMITAAYFEQSAEPVVLTGSAGVAEVEGVAGALVLAVVLVPGGTGVAAVEGTAGTLDLAGLAAAGSTGVLSLTGQAGTLVAGELVLAGSAGHLSMVGTAGTIDDAPLALPGSVGLIEVAGATGSIAAGALSITGSTGTAAVEGVAGSVTVDPLALAAATGLLELEGVAGTLAVAAILAASTGLLRLAGVAGALVLAGAGPDVIGPLVTRATDERRYTHATDTERATMAADTRRTTRDPS